MNTTIYTLSLVAFAAIIHSGFSLGASMMALLSGHSLSRRASHARLLLLSGGFVLGSFAMILLLLLALTYTSLLTFAVAYPIVYLTLGTVTTVTGVWVLFFYYRRGKRGSALWLPRSFARYLSERTAHTKSGAESFVLGAASVIYELPVTLWLLLIAATTIPTVAPFQQIPIILLYAVLAVVTLLFVFVLIGGGHTGANLLRFRTDYKRYLQALIGLSMIALGASIFWDHYSTFLAAQGIML